MRTIRISVALAFATGCAGVRRYRPGPTHAGIRAYLDERSPMNANFPGGGRKSQPPWSTLPDWPRNGG